MPVLTESDLRRAADGVVVGTIASEQRKYSRWQTVKSVFLSHSSKDADMAIIVKTIIESMDIPVYVDWLDAGLPIGVTANTARILRARIEENDLLLMLCTNNALESRWVPWELGFADGRKGTHRVAVLEARRDGETYRGSEYVDLYTKIRLPGVSSYFVGESRHATASADTVMDLKSWIKS